MVWVLLAQHAAFFVLFALRLAGVIRPGGRGAGDAAVAATVHAKPRAAFLLIAHAAAFAVFYGGLLLALASSGGRIGMVRPLLGAVMNLLAMALLTWTLLVFRSWRLLAQLDRGHELCTGGPFRWVRHPIYLACDLLALGTAIWVWTLVVWAGAILVIVGADLRARAEERILLEGFGERYQRYMNQSSRLIPRLY